MLSLTESMLIARNNDNVAHAEHSMTLLQNEIVRLRGVVSQQAGVINQQANTIRAQEQQDKADQCSIAGYRAYVEHMRSVCTESTLEAASDAYIVARDAKAQALGVKVPEDKKHRDT